MGKIVVVVVFSLYFPCQLSVVMEKGVGSVCLWVLWFAQNWGVARVLAKHAQVNTCLTGFKPLDLVFECTCVVPPMTLICCHGYICHFVSLQVVFKTRIYHCNINSQVRVM